MEAKTKDLWVFVETNEDGTAKNVGIELLTPGKMMAGKQGGALVAVVIGSGVPKISPTSLNPTMAAPTIIAMSAWLRRVRPITSRLKVTLLRL